VLSALLLLTACTVLHGIRSPNLQCTPKMTWVCTQLLRPWRCLKVACATQLCATCGNVAPCRSSCSTGLVQLHFSGANDSRQGAAFAKGVGLVSGCKPQSMLLLSHTSSWWHITHAHVCCWKPITGAWAPKLARSFESSLLVSLQASGPPAGDQQPLHGAGILRRSLWG
jgi:hypothetical protein